MTGLRIASYAASSTMDPHRHEESSLCVVLHGSYLERVQKREHEHGAGHMLFYPSFALHSQSFGAAGAQKLIFTPDASSLEYLEDRGMFLSRASAVQSPLVSQLAYRVLSELRSNDDFTPMAVQGLLLELVAGFARSSARDEARTSPAAWLRLAKDLIQDTIADEITIEDIAAQVGKHPVHLSRAFRLQYGETIGSYQRTLRLQAARTQLLHSQTPLTEIALSSGFASHAHLCRSFKAAYGTSPSIFRSLYRS